MLNPKKIVFPAGFGFVLFFLVSLIFAGGGTIAHRFFHALLRGVVFGLLFGLIFFALDYIFTRFLNDGVDVEAAPSVPRSTVRSGSRIDITISDEELTDDGQGFKFSVAKNKHALPKEDLRDIRAAAPEAAPAAAAAPPPPAPRAAEPAAASAPAGAAEPAPAPEPQGFTPVSLGALSSGKGSASPAGGQPAPGGAAAKAPEQDGSLDELPEISDFVPKISSGAQKEDIIEDSDFASEGVKKSASDKTLFADGSRASDHDTATLAKAIQTVLKRDD